MSELCSYCYTERIAMMQRSPFSIYSEQWKRKLDFVNSRCGSSFNTALPPSQEAPRTPVTDWCTSESTVCTTAQTTCDELALAHRVASAALYTAN